MQIRLGANYHLYGVGMQSTIEQRRTDLGLIKLFYSCRDTLAHVSIPRSDQSAVHLERPIIILARCCSNRIIYFIFTVEAAPLLQNNDENLLLERASVFVCFCSNCFGTKLHACRVSYTRGDNYTRPKVYFAGMRRKIVVINYHLAA
jgi:hypothetical protein